jgi:hypothetical protein
MEYALDAIWGQRLCLRSQPCVKLLCVPGPPFDLRLLFFGPLATPPLALGAVDSVIVPRLSSTVWMFLARGAGAGIIDVRN